MVEGFSAAEMAETFEAAFPAPEVRVPSLAHRVGVVYPAQIR
jgi:hypothetical protein